MAPQAVSASRSPKASPLVYFHKRTPAASPLSHHIHNSISQSPASSHSQYHGSVQTNSAINGEPVADSPVNNTSLDPSNQVRI